MVKSVSPLEGKGQEKTKSGHLDYDLDQLLENIRTAQNSTSVPDIEVRYGYS